jgi:methyl-accepting chemotaxis protein
MLRKLNIKARILGMLGVLAGGYLILLIVTLTSANITHNRMAEISSAFFPAALRMQDVEADFERMKKHYQDAVVLQDQNALATGDKDAADTAEALSAVKIAVAGVPALASVAKRLETEFASLRPRNHETYAAILANPNGPTPELMTGMSGLGKENKALTESFSAFDQTIAADFQTQLTTVNAWSVRSKVVGFVMLAFAIFSCAGAWWVVQFKVVFPLRSLAARIRDIAEGEGDLTRRIEITGRNEIDEVGMWLNEFLSKLQDVIRNVKQSTSRLTDSCEGLTLSTAHMAKGAEAQEGQTAMVATAILEMAATVTEISRNSSTAAQKTRKAADDAREGGEVVAQSVAMMEEVATSVDGVARLITELGERSRQVAKIVEAIDDIAARTNLLALNAAIEAARAGEGGKGFAVVAGEVRSLAERTTNSTKEIANVIGAFQRETEAAARAMDRGTAEVRRTVTTAGEAGVKLRMIIESADHAAEMVNCIATAAVQQSSANEEMNSRIKEIAHVSNETAREAQSSAKACDELAQLAIELNARVSQFRVADQSSSASLDSAETSSLGQPQRSGSWNLPTTAHMRAG